MHWPCHGSVLFLLLASCGFKQPLSDVRTVRLPDKTGRSVGLLAPDSLTLLVFVSPTCLACKLASPVLDQAVRRFIAMGLASRTVFIAIPSDPTSKYSPASVLRIAGPTLLDSASRSARALGVDGTPELVVVGLDGLIVLRSRVGAFVDSLPQSIYDSVASFHMPTRKGR